MTLEVPIWYCLSEDIKDKLRKRLKKSWTPPVIIDAETPEEIDKLMKKKPRRRNDGK